MKALIYGGAAVTMIYAALCVLVYLAQDRLLYLPPPDFGRPAARSLTLECGEATLRIGELHAQQRAALIYFGGNAEDVGANAADFDRAFPDRAVYLVNYRGYGGSTGRPSEAALICDAVAAYDWVSLRHDRVAVIGRSLGSGVAAALATRRPIERLVLVTPFDSIANVAADHFSWLPVRWLLKDRYDSQTRIGTVRAPVLALVAEHDEVVFRPRSDALIAAIPENIRQVVLVAGATHNDISDFPAYLQRLKEFLEGRP